MGCLFLVPRCGRNYLEEARQNPIKNEEQQAFRYIRPIRCHKTKFSIIFPLHKWEFDFIPLHKRRVSYIIFPTKFGRHNHRTRGRWCANENLIRKAQWRKNQLMDDNTCCGAPSLASEVNLYRKHRPVIGLVHLTTHSHRTTICLRDANYPLIVM
jgi:hypothetical protein